MFDNILNSVKKGAERVQQRGEEVAQAARLRLEVFQLNRELESVYARLGRSFYSGMDAQILQPIRDEVVRIEQEIKARERLITELGGDLNSAPVKGEGSGEVSSAIVSATASPSAQGSIPTSTDSMSNSPLNLNKPE